MTTMSRGEGALLHEIHFVSYTNESLLRKNNKDKSFKMNNRGTTKSTNITNNS